MPRVAFGKCGFPANLTTRLEVPPIWTEVSVWFAACGIAGEVANSGVMAGSDSGSALAT